MERSDSGDDSGNNSSRVNKSVYPFWKPTDVPLSLIHSPVIKTGNGDAEVYEESIDPMQEVSSQTEPSPVRASICLISDEHANTASTSSSVSSNGFFNITNIKENTWTNVSDKTRSNCI